MPSSGTPLVPLSAPVRTAWWRTRPAALIATAIVALGVVVTVVALRGSSTSSSAASTKVGQWYLSTGGSHEAEITGDLALIRKDGQAPPFHGLAEACSALLGDVGRSQASAQVPDGVAQQHWAAALKDLYAVAFSCNSGVHLQSASMLSEVAADLDPGAAELAAVHKRLVKLGIER